MPNSSCGVAATLLITLRSRVHAARDKQQVTGTEIVAAGPGSPRTLDKIAANIHAVDAVSTSNGLSAKTVLIVDDDEEVRHVLRLLCEHDDLEVVGEADNGVAAIPLALSHQPDFVILDYRLPRLDGEGAAEILRAVTPDSKIVAFSALLDTQPDWADGYLNKDRVAELMPLLRTFIR